MSHRHQAQRRRTYGRRQHEVHQRRPGTAVDDAATDSPFEGFDVGSGTDRAVASDPETEPAAVVASFPGLFAPGLSWAQGRR